MPAARKLDGRRDPLGLARAIGMSGEVGQSLAGVRIAAADGRLGQNGLGQELDDGDEPRMLRVMASVTRPHIRRALLAHGR